MTGLSIFTYPCSFELLEEDVGGRIETTLRRRLKCQPTHVYKLLRQVRVTFVPAGGGDPRPMAMGDVVAESGRLDVAARGEQPPPQPNASLWIGVLHEDEHMVAVDKPSGLAVHPGPGIPGTSLIQGLVARWPGLLSLGRERGYGLVHRLDVGTSGVLLVAKTEAAYDALTEAFATRKVEKRYTAFVDGRAPGLDVKSCTVDRPIDGKHAVTEVQFDEWAGPVGRVSLRPLTGRTHQIRIHLAHLRMPVLFDERYGHRSDELTARISLRRLGLHAESIRVPHPTTGEPLEVERPLPRDLKRAWRRAEHVFLNGAM